MTDNAKFMLIVAMDVDADKEALLGEVYDTEHIPAILKVPGVISVARLRGEPLRIGIAGEILEISDQGEPKFTAIYEIDNPEVLISPEWRNAVEMGRWPTEVRPYTRNRRMRLHKIINN